MKMGDLFKCRFLSQVVCLQFNMKFNCNSDSNSLVFVKVHFVSFFYLPYLQEIKKNLA